MTSFEEKRVHQRISHSILDPLIGPKLKAIYPYLPIPRRFPPEGIVLIGHLLAITGAIGFAYSLSTWWGGWLAAFGIAGNHFADCVDGTHARATHQCRNGGELLDHFTDPLSFAYWLIGWSVAISRLDLGLAAVTILFATAVLTNIKAKLIGEFSLAAFGPTEFKTLLCLYGMVIGVLHWNNISVGPIAQLAFIALISIGALQLLINLITSVREVNENGPAPDTSEWQTVRSESNPKNASSQISN